MYAPKRLDEAPMTFNMARWKGVVMPEVQEPITILRWSSEVCHANELRDISFYLDNLRNVWPLVDTVF